MALGCGDIRDLAKLLNISNPDDNDQQSSSDDDEEASRKKLSLKLGKITIGSPICLCIPNTKTTFDAIN